MTWSFPFPRPGAIAFLLLCFLSAPPAAAERAGDFIPAADTLRGVDGVPRPPGAIGYRHIRGQVIWVFADGRGLGTPPPTLPPPRTAPPLPTRPPTGTAPGDTGQGQLHYLDSYTSGVNGYTRPRGAYAYRFRENGVVEWVFNNYFRDTYPAVARGSAVAELALDRLTSRTPRLSDRMRPPAECGQFLFVRNGSRLMTIARPGESVTELVTVGGVRSVACREDVLAVVAESGELKAATVALDATSSTRRADAPLTGVLLYVFRGNRLVSLSDADGARYTRVAFREVPTGTWRLQSWDDRGLVRRLTPDGAFVPVELPAPHCPSYAFRLESSRGDVSVSLRQGETAKLLFSIEKLHGDVVCSGDALTFLADRIHANSALRVQLNAETSDVGAEALGRAATRALFVVQGDRLVSARRGPHARVAADTNGSGTPIFRAWDGAGTPEEISRDGSYPRFDFPVGESCHRYGMRLESREGEVSLAFRGPRGVVPITRFARTALKSYACEGDSLALVLEGEWPGADGRRVAGRRFFLYREGRLAQEAAGDLRGVAVRENPAGAKIFRVWRSGGARELDYALDGTFPKVPLTLPAACRRFRLVTEDASQLVSVAAVEGDTVTPLAAVTGLLQVACVGNALAVIADGLTARPGLVVGLNAETSRLAANRVEGTGTRQLFVFQGRRLVSASDGTYSAVSAGADFLRAWHATRGQEELLPDGRFRRVDIAMPERCEYVLRTENRDGDILLFRRQGGGAEPKRLGVLRGLEHFACAPGSFALVATRFRPENGIELGLDRTASYLTAATMAAGTGNLALLFAGDRIVLANRPARGGYVRSGFREQDRESFVRFWVRYPLPGPLPERVGEEAQSFSLAGRTRQVDLTGAPDCGDWVFRPIKENEITVARKAPAGETLLARIVGLKSVACRGARVALVADGLLPAEGLRTELDARVTNVTAEEAYGIAGGVYLIDGAKLVGVRRAPSGRFASVTAEGARGIEFRVWPNRPADSLEYTLILAGDGSAYRVAVPAAAPAQAFVGEWVALAERRFRYESAPEREGSYLESQAAPRVTPILAALFPRDAGPGSFAGLAAPAAVPVPTTAVPSLLTAVSRREPVPTTEEFFANALARSADLPATHAYGDAKALFDAAEKPSMDTFRSRAVWVGKCVYRAAPRSEVSAALAIIPENGGNSWAALRERQDVTEVLAPRAVADATYYQQREAADITRFWDARKAEGASWSYLADVGTRGFPDDSVYFQFERKAEERLFTSRGYKLKRLESASGRVYLVLEAYCPSRQGATHAGGEFHLRYGDHLEYCYFDTQWAW